MPRLFLLPADKGKRAIVWAPLFFAVSQILLCLCLEGRRPEMADPIYEIRLRSLRARLERSPGAPLVLALGSSRTKYGLWPAVMPLGSTPDAPPPVVYNFAFNGAGTIRQLMYFRRLLADGIRPDWLLIETWPPVWAEDGFFAERRMIVNEDRLHWRDAPLLFRYYYRDPTVLAWAARQLLPLRFHRSHLIETCAPFLLSRGQVRALAEYRTDWEPFDDTGWFACPYGPTTAEEKDRLMAKNHEELGPRLQNVRIDPRSDHALRAILDECRARGIRAVLFLMPEHSAVRGWYSPQSRARVQDYLGGIGREYGVPVLDTQDWAPDEAFADGYHMWRHGAAPFSERFGREVLRPLLEGRSREPSGT